MNNQLKGVHESPNVISGNVARHLMKTKSSTTPIALYSADEMSRENNENNMTKPKRYYWKVKIVSRDV